MFVQVKWHGTGSSYFRRAPVDSTARVPVEELKCRPSRGIGSGAAKRPAPVRWEQSFERACCDMTPVAGNTGRGVAVAVAAGGEDEEGGGGRVSGKGFEGRAALASSPAGESGGGGGGYHPWELRLSVRKIAPGEAKAAARPKRFLLRSTFVCEVKSFFEIR